MTLDTILVVPTLSYNILSVGKITSTLYCTVTFWSLFCFSYFHFIHEFVTIIMDSSILYFRILPWFWKVNGSCFIFRMFSLATLEIQLTLCFIFWQRSGEFLVFLGLNAENEIFHTLSFLAGVMVWSQVHMDIFLDSCS